MAANITNNIGSWNVTAASNQPDAADTADLQADLQAIQSAVKKIRAISADIASGATVDLSTATGDFVTVTGTTGITAFGTVAAGLRYIVRFSGSLNITHDGTSLILPGGTNITTQANDILWMESLGSGNWRCLAYIPVQRGMDWSFISVGGSRVVGTEYTNSKNYPIHVVATIYKDTGAGENAYFYIGAAPIILHYFSTTNEYHTFGPILVAPGATYKIDATTAANFTVYTWYEIQ